MLVGSGLFPLGKKCDLLDSLHAVVAEIVKIRGFSIDDAIHAKDSERAFAHCLSRYILGTRNR